ncbi:MAG: LysM domain-containing protein, partial [Anaerolineae bacterium]|nr:LysM domain-containing protein [Anaerolineae bacterium]
MTTPSQCARHMPGRLLDLLICVAMAAALLVIGALTLRVAAEPADTTPTPTPFDDVLSMGRWAALQPVLEQMPRLWIITHTVAAGESVWSIAYNYGLDPDTLRWSNPDLARNPDLITVGQELTILPVPGVYHTVKGNETVESLARTYGVAPEDITGYHLNHLQPPYRLVQGQKLVIPYGRKTTHWPRPSLAPDYPFAWPAAEKSWEWPQRAGSWVCMVAGARRAALPLVGLRGGRVAFA